MASELRRRIKPSGEEQRLPPRGRLEFVLSGVLVVLVVGSCAAIGAVHVPVMVAFGVLASAAAVLSVLLATSASAPPRIALPALVCFVLAGLTFLQTVPLPVGALGKLAPANADVWDRALLPSGERVSYGSLSLDPGASASEALKWFSYGCVMLASSVISARRGPGWGVAVVFCSGLVAALVTLAHGLVGATRVWGIYEPQFAVLPWHVGPLLNPNNLAGYLNLSILCGAGLALARRPLLPVWFVGPAMAAIVGVEVTAASRGGAAVLPLGIVAFGVIVWRRRRAGSGAGEPPGKLKWLLGAALAGGFLLAALGGTRAVWAELYSKNLDKASMLLWVRPMIAQHPWFGIGRGAFESVFPAYRFTPGNIVYTHIESFPAQWVTEWGLPAGIAALAMFAWVLRPRRLGVQRSAVAAGAWVGVVIVAVQNMADLALEVPAVCFAVAMSIGTLWGASNRTRSAEPRTDGSAGWRLARINASVWVGACAAVLTAMVIGVGRHDLAADRESLRHSAGVVDWRDAGAVGELRQRLRGALLRHPADPYFPLVGALAAWRARDQDALPWLQRSLERAPTYGRAHLLLAEVLAGRGARRQALFELRLAAESDLGVIPHANQLAIRWAQGFEEILLAMPQGTHGGLALDDLAPRLPPEDSALRALCDTEAIARDPTRVAPRVRLAMDRITALAHAGPTEACPDRSACEREVNAHADAIAALQPQTSVAAQLRARMLLAEGKPTEAERLLAEVCDRMADAAACLNTRVEIASKVTGPDALTKAGKDLLSSSCASAAHCADTETWLANLHAERGEVQAALGHYARAARTDPTDARWLRLADVASRAKAHAQAVEALERVAQRRGADTELRRRIEEQRALALGGLIRE